MSHNRLAFITQEIEDASLPPPNWTMTARNRQKQLCRFCSAMREKVGGESQLLVRNHFICQVQFLVARSLEYKKLLDLGLLRSETVY